MDNSVLKLLKQGDAGTKLTYEDWQLLLQDASDAASLNGVYVAAFKLNTKPPTETLENLLLSALCVGACEVAIDTSKEIKRDLTELEKRLLIEGAVLFGDIGGFHKCIKIDDESILGMFHSCGMIAACRALRVRRGEDLPTHINLHSWVTVYAKELSFFNFEYATSIETQDPLPGTFFILNEASRNLLVGALIVSDLISRECIHTLLLLEM